MVQGSSPNIYSSTCKHFAATFTYSGMPRKRSTPAISSSAACSNVMSSAAIADDVAPEHETTDVDADTPSEPVDDAAEDELNAVLLVAATTADIDASDDENSDDEDAVASDDSTDAKRTANYIFANIKLGPNCMALDIFLQLSFVYFSSTGRYIFCCLQRLLFK